MLTRPTQSSFQVVIAALSARFGERLTTSTAVRQAHGHTTTWCANQPPDAVFFPDSAAEVQRCVGICAEHGVPIIPFGTGTSLEGHVNAPYGGISIDFSSMNRIVECHPKTSIAWSSPGSPESS